MPGTLDLIELSDRFRRFGAPLPVQQDVAKKLVNAARVFATRLTYYYPEYGIKASVNAQPIRNLAQSVSEISALLHEAGYSSAILPLNEAYPDAQKMRRILGLDSVNVQGGDKVALLLQANGAEYNLDLSAQGYAMDCTIKTVLDEGYRGGFSIDDDLKSRWRREEKLQNQTTFDWDEPS